MSTTTKKDEKEVAKDVTSLETAINNLSYVQLAELLDAKKQHEIEAVTHRLKEARGIVASLEAQLENLGVVTAPVAAPAKRGRKPNAFKMNGGTPKQGRKSKAPKGKRGAVGEAITKFVTSKGKAGAHVSDIATALDMKKANVTAFFYAKSNKGKFKPLGGATFASAK